MENVVLFLCSKLLTEPFVNQFFFCFARTKACFSSNLLLLFIFQAFTLLGFSFHVDFIWTNLQTVWLFDGHNYPAVCFISFQGAVKVMAKDLVRTRHQIEKFYKLKSQLQGVSLRIQVCFTFCYIGDYKSGIYRYTHFCYILLQLFTQFLQLFVLDLMVSWTYLLFLWEILESCHMILNN